MVSETVSMNFLYSVTLTSIHWSICTLKESFTHPWFWDIKHWPCGKHWLSGLCRCSRCWHMLVYKISSAYLLIPSLTFKHQRAVKLTEADTRFPKFWVLLESSNVVVGDRYCGLLSLKWQANVSLWGSVCQIPSLNNYSLSFVLSSKNGVSLKRKKKKKKERKKEKKRPGLCTRVRRLWHQTVLGDSSSSQDDRGCLQRPSRDEGPS